MTDAVRAAEDRPFGSFRDPGGHLISLDQRVLRVVLPTGRGNLSTMLNSAALAQFVGNGKLVRTRALEDGERRQVSEQLALPAALCDEPDATIVESERIEFASYPYEWPPEMLHAAAELTIDLCEALLAENRGLKDATPYNVLFRGATPVFIDVLSFEDRDPRDPVWRAYAQFWRTFLLPLLVNRHLHLPLEQLFITRRDGIEPQEVFAWLPPLRKLLPPFLTMVSLPNWLNSKSDQKTMDRYEVRRIGNPAKVRFVLGYLFRNLRRKLCKLAPQQTRSSAWSEYSRHNISYSRGESQAKEAFVEAALAEFPRQHVLDIGCNDGVFSTMAARHGASVVAVDSDPVVVGRLWRKASTDRLDILPLVVNLCRPSPALGWRNSECPPFLQRARGRFDLLLALAVLHHILAQERVPLADVISLFAELTTDLAIIEFIDPQDLMFRSLSRGRDELHKNLSVSVFESCCRREFDEVRSEQVSPTRWIHLLRKKTG
jgi:SAM-dependent methyltransferase